MMGIQSMQIASTSKVWSDIPDWTTSPILKKPKNVNAKILANKLASKYELQIFGNQKIKLDQIWPPPITHIINFILHMSTDNYSADTIMSHISGLNFSIYFYNRHHIPWNPNQHYRYKVPNHN
jgi:hypothetical protein